VPPVEREQAGIRARLRAGLPVAMKARDAAAVAALRSALAAIENAEAPDAAQAPPATVTHADVAGTVAGLGAAEVPRRMVTETQAEGIVRAEVADRLAAADGYERAGQPDQADRLRAEARALGGYLGGAAPGAGRSPAG
jgi:uncharacterized protein YqeY